VPPVWIERKPVAHCQEPLQLAFSISRGLEGKISSVEVR